MYIESIFIKRFGGLQNFSVNLSNQLNIIEGNNESGKTTVSAFIKFLFYGFKDKRERSLHMTWNSDNISGELVLSTANGRFRIERECTAGGVDNARIIDLQTNTVIHKGKSPSDVFLKMPADVFERTVYVKQADNGHVDSKGISEAIENLLYSADETVNVNRALKKLDDARTILLHKNRKGGKIFELETELELLKVRLNQAIEGNKGVIIKESSLNDIFQKMSDNQTRQKYLGEKIKQIENSTLVRQHNNINELKNSIASLDREITELKSEYMGETNFLPDLQYIEKIRNCEHELSVVENDIKSADKRIAELEKEFQEDSETIKKIDKYGGQAELFDLIDSHLMRRRTLLLFGIIFGVLCALTAFLGIITMLLNNLIGTFIFIISAALLFGAVICFVGGSRQAAIYNDIFDDFDVEDEDDLKSLIESENIDAENKKNQQDGLYSIQKKRVMLAEQQSKINNVISGYLKIWNKPNAASAINNAEKYLYLLKEKQHELDKCRVTYNSILEQLKNSEYDENQLNDYVKKTAASAVQGDTENTDIRTLRREYDFLYKSTEALKSRAHELEKQLIALKSEVESPAIISDRINEITKKTDELRFCHDAYLLAYQKLEEASYKLKENISPRLSEDSSRMISRFTDAKYNLLGIGHELEIEYRTADNVTRGSEFMSAGTLDIAYISLRFALTNLLYGDEKPPVIFDESFARLDDKRLENALRLLRDISDENMQVIILTSQKRDAVIMNQISSEYNLIKI